MGAYGGALTLWFDQTTRAWWIGVNEQPKLYGPFGDSEAETARQLHGAEAFA